MIIDCHVHISAFTPAHGFLSDQLQRSLPFRFMRWRLGMHGSDESTERALENHLIELLDQTPEIDGVALLAFDGVYDKAGRFDRARTHLYVTNDYCHRVGRQASQDPFRGVRAPFPKRCDPGN